MHVCYIGVSTLSHQIAQKTWAGGVLPSSPSQIRAILKIAMCSVSEREPWQAIVKRKQDERERKIPAEWRLPSTLLPKQDVGDVFNFPRTSGFFTPRELELTNVDASNVVAKIAAGECTSEEVTRAVCKRAAVAQQLLNCLTEICFDEAIARAKELDRKLKEDGQVVGPLHGLPIR